MIKEKLKTGQPYFGVWLQIPYAPLAELLASLGFDWVCIDLEHSPMTIEQAMHLIMAIERGGSMPFVRIPKNDHVWIKYMLDSGAKGIIIPMINSQEDACKAVMDCSYGGSRSFGYCRANLLGEKFNDYVHEFNPVIILQIEHEKAIRNLDLILQVPYINATFTGPYDLSGSLGVPGEFESEIYLSAIKTYEDKSKQHNVPFGAHIVRPTKDLIKSHVDKGYTFIALGIDAVFACEKAKDILKCKP
jgi:2-keto-3-deoxy-L-rhamnonate aldolase RhmA|tara:strand:- start:6571 stop:7308 length:738 start_codon:yes stop_codon:yes gene_type:complete